MKAATLINTAFATIDFKYQTFKNKLFVLIPFVAYNFPPVIENTYAMIIKMILLKAFFCTSKSVA